MTKPAWNRCRCGFTLVELLVVIGIIALLIAILMPTLSRARQSAQKTACAAKLHAIVIAAQTHAINHRGYYPLVGTLPGCEPADLEDAYATKYDYVFILAGQSPKCPAPITFDLATDMSFPLALKNADLPTLNAEWFQNNGLSRLVLCPSQATTAGDLQQSGLLWVCDNPGSGELYDFWQPGSYIFNEAVCGWGLDVPGADINTRLRGKASSVHQPAQTMFVADGLPGSLLARTFWCGGYSNYGMSTLYNELPYLPATMADALKGDANPGDVAGDNESFDLRRHQGRINIGFCDGHVESRMISVKDLSSVYLLAP